MGRFIGEENVKRLKRQLEQCSDSARRSTLEELLEENADKLRKILSGGS